MSFHVSTYEGKIYAPGGIELVPDNNGIVTVDVEGKPRRFVASKLADYLSKNNMIKPPVLKKKKEKKTKRVRVVGGPKKKQKNYHKRNYRQGFHRRKSVVAIDKDGGRTPFVSITAAAGSLGMNRNTIGDCLQIPGRVSCGYKFEYSTENSDQINQGNQ